MGITCNAQDIELIVTGQPKVFFESTKVKDNSTTFAYLEATYNGGAMMKLFHEQKFWKKPIFLHLEYQTTFTNHTAIAGGSYSFFVKNGYISMGLFARYDWGINRFAAQISNSYLFSWKWGDFNGYNHLWYNGQWNFFGEERLNINLTPQIAISGILDISYFGEFNLIPCLGVRYRL